MHAFNKKKAETIRNYLVLRKIAPRILFIKLICLQKYTLQNKKAKRIMNNFVFEKVLLEHTIE